MNCDLPRMMQQFLKQYSGSIVLVDLSAIAGADEERDILISRILRADQF